MADKYAYINGTTIGEKSFITTTTGSGDAGKGIGTDATGHIDPALLPTGIGADTTSIQCTEDLGAGDLVNVYDGGSGVFRCRKADADANKPAHGFVKAAFTTGQSATVYSGGNNDVLSALAPGDYYLSKTAGGIVTQAAAAAYATTGDIIQYVGYAGNATTLCFQRGPVYVKG